MEFEEFKDKATDVAQVTSKKVAEIYASAKIKLAISEKRTNLRALYRELGEIVYKASKGEAEDDVQNNIEDKIAEIDIAREVIAELKEKEKELRNLTTCPYCDERIPENANFCPNCGKERE